MKPIFPLILPHVAHAGKIIESFKSSFSVTNKADESPVTEADIQASAYLVKSIHEFFPEDLVLSEENLIDIDFSQRIWLIDPLDGTKNFISWEKTYSIMLSCVDKGHPILGIIYYPATWKIFIAEEGFGAYTWTCSQYEKMSIHWKVDLDNIKTIYKPSVTKFESTMKLVKEMEAFWIVQELRPTGFVCTEILEQRYDVLVLWGWNIYEIGAIDCLVNELGWFFGDLNGKRLEYVNGVLRFNYGCLATWSKDYLSKIPQVI